MNVFSYLKQDTERAATENNALPKRSKERTNYFKFNTEVQLYVKKRDKNLVCEVLSCNNFEPEKLRLHIISVKTTCELQPINRYFFRMFITMDRHMILKC